MIRVEGQVKISGSVAYAPQTPWIMSATLRSSQLLTMFHGMLLTMSCRDNIIFSHTYDETFYNLVLDGNVHVLLLLFAYADLIERSLCFAPRSGASRKGRSHDSG